MTLISSASTATFNLLAPTAHITIGNDRLKIYPNNKLYMKNGQEFKFEFFNPRTTNVLAVIYINGKRISDSGLVIRPGQRVYLDRYIDTAKKFKFETYVVEDSKETAKAIANNGFIKVEFYDEQVYYGNYIINTPITWSTDLSAFYCTSGNSGTININSNVGTTLTLDEANNMINCSNTATAMYCSSDISRGITVKAETPKETGRIEQGGSSNQKLVNSTGDYQSFPFATMEYQILPESAMNKEAEDIKQYCPGCRYRIRKQTWKFCPKCGEEL